MDAFRAWSVANSCIAVLASWFILVAARTLIKAYRPPLSDLPGPWIAKFTKLWLLRAINTRSWEKINIELHRQYGEHEHWFPTPKKYLILCVGPVVRISPNECSLDDPDAVKIIYRTRDELVKVGTTLLDDIYEPADRHQGERYSGWGLPGVEPMIFTQRDIERHSQRTKEVSGLYSNSVLHNMEGPVDRVIEALFDRLYEFAERGEVVEISDWLHYFAFDAIGVFTARTQIPP